VRLQENGGCIIYLQQQQGGRGIGLANKVAAYHLQERDLDTVDANRVLGFADDYRTYECAR
jgi:GTP cyclohydrolase II